MRTRLLSIAVVAIATVGSLTAQLQVVATVNQFSAGSRSLAPGFVLGTHSGTTHSVGINGCRLSYTVPYADSDLHRMELAFDAQHISVPPTLETCDLRADLSIAISSAIPLPVRIDSTLLGLDNGNVTIGGASVTSPTTIVLRSTPTVIRVSASITVTDTVYFRAGLAAIEVTPTTFAFPYGIPCNASLVDIASLSGGASVTVTDSLASMGVLLIGTTETFLPLNTVVPIPNWTCPLQTDILVSAPLTLTGGSATFPFLAPVGSFTMQVLTVPTDLGTVHATNGLRFVRAR